MAASKQFMIRMPEAAIERLAEIALGHGLVGGRGRQDQAGPNLAAATRFVLGQGDEKLAAIFHEADKTS